MRKTTDRRVLALAWAVACAACDSTNQAGPVASVDPSTLYGQMCARCHGRDGRGDFEMRKTMPAVGDFTNPLFRSRSPEEIEQVIAAGRKQMPAFGGALTALKIQHLGGYVRRLAMDDLGAGGFRQPNARLVLSRIRIDRKEVEEAIENAARQDQNSPAPAPAREGEPR